MTKLEAFIIAGFLAAAIIAAAFAFLLTKDKRLRAAGLLMISNCILSNVLVANYQSLSDLEQYMAVPSICYITIYMLNIEHKARWLTLLHWLFLVEILVSMARAFEWISHMAYFVTVDATYAIECLTICVAAICYAVAKAQKVLVRV